MQASTEESRRQTMGSHVWRNSLKRSSKACEMQTVIHNYGPGDAQLWWGPVLPVERGSLIHYFNGPVGVAIEWVDPPRPRLPEQH